MNDLFERIISLSLKARLGILFAALAVVAGVFYLNFYSALEEQLSEKSVAVAKLETQVSEKQQVVGNLPRIQAEVARLKVELSKAMLELPDETEIERLLESIADKAKDSGLDVKSFKTKAEIARDFYAEKPMEIEVAGGYHQIAAFFDEVGHLDRIVNLSNLSLLRPKTDESGEVLNASMIATAFRFLPEKERPKEVSKSKRKSQPKAGKKSAE